MTVPACCVADNCACSSGISGGVRDPEKKVLLFHMPVYIRIIYFNINNSQLTFSI